MSIITTTKNFQPGDTFIFTVAAKNGYGINYHEVPSMQEYLVSGTESIKNVGSEFPGNHNKNLYPGVEISGMLETTSVGYNILLDNSGAVRQLSYIVNFYAENNPITGNQVLIRIEGIPNNVIDPYIWSPEPLVLQMPEIVITEPESGDILFVAWHCVNDNTDYNAGSRIFVNDDMVFIAKWIVAPVSVSVENDTDNSDVPEFDENE